ncbi:hypothetical protein Q8F55_005514 [Vanrija albida]|uniref:CRAL-TRIO domain-containing protein n=1 Tax=Vanrija albida TaxID=181172 RepID=A0ABR3Q1V2_9TREE
MALDTDRDGAGGGPVAVKRAEPSAFPFGFGSAPSSSAGPAAPPAFATAAARRAELGAHAPLVAQLQRELEDDVDDLINEEGWDHATAAGAQDWASDYGMVFRALRRNHYNTDKTHHHLLGALQRRADRGLGGVIPPPPSPLLSLLPLPKVVDRLGRPIAVLTLRDVVRDSSGSLSELKEWIWWGLELVRRALRDYWVHGRRGNGAEGAVLLIDVSGAGYRNMEVELLPTVFSVGHGNFPGLFENVYVINAGWSHRAMWNSVVKRVLPRSSLEKVSFLDTPESKAAVFDLDVLPPEYGGTGPEVDMEASLRKYSHARPNAPSRGQSRVHSVANSRAPSRANSRPPSRDPSRSRGGSRGPSRAPSLGPPGRRSRSVSREPPTRSTSMASIADIYYTAPPSPSGTFYSANGTSYTPSRAGSYAASSVATSRAPSRRSSFGQALSGGLSGLTGLTSRLAMTKSHSDVRAVAAVHDDDDHVHFADGPDRSDEVRRGRGRGRGRSLGPNDSPVLLQAAPEVSPRPDLHIDTGSGPATSYTGASDVSPIEQEAPPKSAIQRIKSLSDFHLYLSPSRLAHRDLLSDSEDDDDDMPPPVHIPLRRTLRPALVDPSALSLAERRAAARRTAGADTPSTPRDKYASMLQEYHARGVEQYRPAALGLCQRAEDDPECSDSTPGSEPPTGPNTAAPTTAIQTPYDEIEPSELGDDDEYYHQVVPVSLPPPGPDVSSPSVSSDSEAVVLSARTPVSARDVQYTSQNPWFGYPVVRVPAGDGYTIRPRYGRNRKRDLVKTLLWLFLMRLQSMRDGFERALGLDKLRRLTSSWGSKKEVAKTPSQGLVDTAAEKRALVKRTGKHDWIWMLIGFLLVRGTWANMLAETLEPLESTFGSGLREWLGLI